MLVENMIVGGESFSRRLQYSKLGTDAQLRASTLTDQYARLVDQLVYMVKELKLMKYNDIGCKISPCKNNYLT